MEPKAEQRKISGRTAYVIAEYTVLEGTFRDFIKNIGAAGVFIKTDRKIAVGQPVSTKFPLLNFDNIVQAYGRVVRRDADGFAVTFNESIEGLVCREGHFPEIVIGANQTN
ncbi:PilZ domain-containing protein [Desulfosarcina variabilis]|uniref:PilZ domain-containing protein n=1 Tax=Desulfosarcina variabilis TaxID=2300 RepID=UPI003AFAFA08